MNSSTVFLATVTIDNTGTTVQLPVIVTVEGILNSYLEYLLIFRVRSESWKGRSVFAVRLLLDYMNANKGVFEKPRDMFREFSNALFTGTIDDDGRDPSTLRWKPRKQADAKFIISLITHYTDYLSEIKEDKNLQLNPFRDASSFEQRLNWAAYYQKKDRAFLSHLWCHPEANRKIRSVNRHNTAMSPGIYDTAKAFPEDRINDLLYQGFVLPGKDHCKITHERLNLRNVLVTILMYYGGLRISEVCHIYVQDIAEFAKGKIHQIVKVYHPSEGISPCNDRITRSEYLKKYFSLKPRNEYPISSKRFAGWKQPMLTNSKDKFFTVEFFPASSREQFFLLWKLYIKYQRVSPETGYEHPYAFTSKNGTPCSIKSYSASRKRAVERIGLAYSKEACTTDHADRHRYGQNLSESGVPPIVIKTAMHHKSVESQQIYTQPTEKEVRHQIELAEQNFLKNV